MIELSTRTRAVRRSRIAFWTVGIVVAIVTTVVGLAITQPLRAVGIGVLAGALTGFVAAVLMFIWPGVRVLWHWAGEITALALLLGAYTALTGFLPWQAALVVLALIVGVLIALPGSRRRIWAWVMCAVTRHRLRVCFAAFLAWQRTGAAPLILLARPTPAGERVWIWLRTGLALADIESRMDRLAAGCWAAECRITPASRRFSALLRLDVARRNPLTTTITSPLPQMVPATVVATAPAAAGRGSRQPGAGLDLPDVTAPPAPSGVDGRRPRKQVAATPEVTTLTVDDILSTPRRVDGDDLSDWI